MINFLKAFKHVFRNWFNITFSVIKNKNNQYSSLSDMPIYIINLEHRNDRLQKTLEILSNYSFLKPKVIKAIKYQPGYIGCSLSHLKVIQRAISEKASFCIVAEDDIELLVEEKELNVLISFFLASRFKVLCIGNTNAKVELNSKHPISKAYNIQTTAFYILKSEYYQKILINFQNSLFKQLNGISDEYCAIDQGWKSLQLKGDFCVPNKNICIQREGYSDIEQSETNYYK